MFRFRPGSLLALAVVMTVGIITLLLLGAGLLPALAAPLWQFPTNSVTIVSDPPPADLPGQFADVTRLQNNLLDPDTAWKSATFDDSGWQAAYPAERLPAWGDPLGDPASPADFIWGGSPGADADGNGRFDIPASPAPQFLFLRKNFCIPINADPNSIAVAGPLNVQVAATSGRGSVYFNQTPLSTSLGGDSDETNTETVNLDATAVGNARLGRNTLAMRIRDDVGDANAAVAYDLTFNYAIDPAALTITANPPSPAPTNTSVTFNQTNTGLSGDSPYTFQWDLGNGTTSTAAAPSVTYTTPGTYTIALTMTDRFGCISAPVTTTYVVFFQPQVTFSSATYTVIEDAGVAVITVILDGPSTNTVTVDVTTADGTATAGSDYTGVTQTLTFPPNTTSQTFTIPIAVDNLTEGDETVTLTLSNPTNATIITPNPATLIIQDIPPTPVPSGGDNDDDDDDDDDAAPPPPPPPATATPTPTTIPIPTTTPTTDFPTMLPETGYLRLTSAARLIDSPLLAWGVIGTLLLATGYYFIRRRRR